MPTSKENCAPESHTTPTRRQGSDRRLRLIAQALATCEEDQRNLPPPPTQPLPAPRGNGMASNAAGPHASSSGEFFPGHNEAPAYPAPIATQMPVRGRSVPGSEQRIRAIQEAFVALGYGPEPGAPAPKIIINPTVAAVPHPRRDRKTLIEIPPTPIPGSRRNPIEISPTPTPGSSRNPIEIPATPVKALVLPTLSEIPATPLHQRPPAKMFTPLFLSPTPSPASAAAILHFDPFVTALDSPPLRPPSKPNRKGL